MKRDAKGRLIRDLHEPDALCRWCPLELVLVNGVVGCVECDELRKWPRYIWPL